MTEVGVIPEDWEVKSIGNDIDLLTGFPFPSSGYSENGIRLLRCSNIKRGVTDWSEDIVQYWPKITLELKPYILNDGDIVVAMDGSLVGKSFARLNNSDLPAILLQRVARIRSTKIYVGYLKEFICSDYFTKYCDQVKTSSAIPHISPGDIKNFRIPLPKTIKEQTAIAEALSDMDALISQTEKLIEKKKAIKQGMMQELLTGKKRLAGFGVNKGYKMTEVGLIPEDWEVMSIGEVMKIRHGKDQKKVQSDTGLYPIYGTGGQMGWSSSFLYDKPSVLIGRKGTIDRPRYIDVPFWTVDTLFYSEIFSIANPYYLYCLYQQIDWYRFNEASGVPSLNARTIESIKIAIPTKVEQTAIAEALSDMDKEISIAEEKLSKQKQQKQGMMQSLLTGKIRLV